jgi:broad specificity phosphatase PhoE
MARPYAHKILFARHGQTSYNAQNRLQGHRDVPLDGKGRQQASAIGRFVRANLSDEMLQLEAESAFWASPLGRTRQTMELARAAMGLPAASYRVDARLKELSFGDWEGLNWGEVSARDPGLVAARQANKWDFTPPSGESYATLTARVAAWLDEREGDLFVVAHGGIARALLTTIGGVAASAAAEVEVAQGRILVFDKGAFAWIG